MVLGGVLNIKLLDKISSQGSFGKPNEDLIIIENGLAVVLDGATGLGGSVINDEVSDAKWFVRKISEYLSPAWNTSNNFVESLKFALETVSELFIRDIRKNNIPKYEQPSSGMIAVALEGGDVNIYRAGDCAAIYQGKHVNVLFENSRLEELDQLSIRLLRQYMNDGLSYSEARNCILPILRSHREKMNTKEGYPSLSVGIDCIDFIEKKCVRPDARDQLLVCSDGFSAIYEKYDSYRIDRFFSAQRDSLEKIVELLRSIEIKDKSLLKYPRLKPHDDATAVLLEFENCL